MVNLRASSAIHTCPRACHFLCFSRLSAVLAFLFLCALNLFIRNVSPSFSSLDTLTMCALRAWTLFQLLICFFLRYALCFSFSFSCNANSAGEILMYWFKNWPYMCPSCSSTLPSHVHWVQILCSFSRLHHHSPDQSHLVAYHIFSLLLVYVCFKTLFAFSSTCFAHDWFFAVFSNHAPVAKFQWKLLPSFTVWVV